MILIKAIQELSGLKGPIVLVVGTFDGVHLGHRALIYRAMEEASSCGGTTVVMTFDRHPAALIRPDKVPALLTRNTEKMALLDALGIPVLLMLEFTPEFASTTARDFIMKLSDSCRPLHAVCVGSEWSFGNGGKGNVALLKKLGAEHDFSVIRISPVKVQGVAVSSTRIRAALATGDFHEAELCLGRHFLLSGSVVRGAGLGSRIGFPTANLDVAGLQLPPNGVYAVKLFRGERILSGVCNIGLRPTVDAAATTPVVEVHLFDFSDNLLCENLSLEFMKFLRPEKKFANIEELKGQIARDCKEAKAVLSS